MWQFLYSLWKTTAIISIHNKYNVQDLKQKKKEIKKVF